MELEKLRESFLDLQDQFDKLKDEKTSIEKTLKESQEKNLVLQDTNHSLFLRITTPKEKESEVEEEKKILIEDIINQIGGN